MSKERLDEIIKQYSAHFNVTGRSIGKSQFRDNLNWLIQQAERVQELEETNKKNYWIAADFKFENLKLEQQNKRYREALEFINEELELVLHSNKGLAEKMFYIENSKRKITEVLERESE